MNMEKEDVRSLLSSLFKVTKVVNNINYSNDAIFKNEGNGKQDFSYAEVFARNNNNQTFSHNAHNNNNNSSSSSNNITTNNNNNIESGRRQNQPVQRCQYQAAQPVSNQSSLQHPTPNINNTAVRSYQAPRPVAHNPTASTTQRPFSGINNATVSPSWDHMKNQAPHSVAHRPAAASWNHMKNQPVSSYRDPHHPVPSAQRFHLHPTATTPRPIGVPSAEANDDEDTDDEDSEDEDTESEDSDDEKSYYYKSKKHVHVGLQQLNGRNIITVVAGIKKKKFDYNEILEDLMEECCCNGRIIMDPHFGKVIQLVGDQRRNVHLFLVQEGIVKKKKHVKISGF